MRELGDYTSHPAHCAAQSYARPMASDCTCGLRKLMRAYEALEISVRAHYDDQGTNWNNDQMLIALRNLDEAKKK